MKPRLMLCIALFPASSGLLTLHAEPAAAAPRSARLEVSIDIERQSNARGANGHHNETTRANYRFSTTVRSDGSLMSINSLDPQAMADVAARGERDQRRVQAALAAQRAQPVRALPAVMTATPMSPAEMQARAMKMQAQCGTDRECLMREASALSLAMAPTDPRVQGRLQGYAAAVQQCEKRHAAAAGARDTCIAQARRDAGGADDSDPADENLPDRYMMFIGQPPCDSSYGVRVDSVAEGATPDITGMVPFRVVLKIDENAAAPGLCGTSLTFDTQTNTWWSSGAVMLPAVRGVITRTEFGRTQRNEGQFGTDWYEAAPWIAEQLKHMTRSGSAQTTLPVQMGSTIETWRLGGERAGKLQVRMSWRIEDR
jgi:hypothetical protein